MGHEEEFLEVDVVKCSVEHKVELWKLSSSFGPNVRDVSRTGFPLLPMQGCMKELLSLDPA